MRYKYWAVKPYGPYVIEWDDILTSLADLEVGLFLIYEPKMRRTSSYILS